MERIADLTKASLHAFVAKAIEPGSTVVTDGDPIWALKVTSTLVKFNVARAKGSICCPGCTEWSVS